MRRIPPKRNQNKQYEVMKNWATAIVETHLPDNNIDIMSRKEFTKPEQFL